MAIVSRDSSPRLKAGAPSQQNDGINGKAEVNCLGFPVFSADVAATVALGWRLLLRWRGYPSPTVAGESTGRTTG